MDTKTIQAFIADKADDHRTVANLVARFGTPSPAQWQRITKYKVGEKDGVGLGQRGDIVRVFMHALCPNVSATVVTDPTDSEILSHTFNVA